MTHVLIAEFLPVGRQIIFGLMKMHKDKQ